jgi:hypothetical protein
MNKGMRNSIIVLVVLIAGYYIISNKQSGLTTKSSIIYTGDVLDIHKVLIQKSGDAIELSKDSDAWSISGNDTLVIRQDKIDNLLNTVLSVSRETLVSENPENWSKYSVDDSTGTHLALIDIENNTIAYFVFGRSRSDYSHNYIRIQDNNAVYLTDQNILHHLNTEETFWGEVPQRDEEIVPGPGLQLPSDIIEKSDTTGAIFNPNDNE